MLHSVKHSFVAYASEAIVARHKSGNQGKEEGCALPATRE